MKPRYGSFFIAITITALPRYPTWDSRTTSRLANLAGPFFILGWQEMTYAEKLKDPRWQKKRLEIFQRDDWTCQFCEETKKTLAVHHLIYQQGQEPWDHENENLITVCETCHQIEREFREDAEKILIECLRLYRFTPDNLYQLKNIICRNIPTIHAGAPADFLLLIDKLI